MGSGPAPGPILKKALCHTRSVGGTEDKYHHKRPTIARPFVTRLILLMGHVSAGHDVMDGSGRVCLVTGYTSGIRGLTPGFNPLRRHWTYCPAPEAPLLGECRWGPRHFWKYRARVGSGPVPGPTLKEALCHTRPVDGTEDKSHPIPSLATDQTETYSL